MMLSSRPYEVLVVAKIRTHYFGPVYCCFQTDLASCQFFFYPKGTAHEYAQLVGVIYKAVSTFYTRMIVQIYLLKDECCQAKVLHLSFLVLCDGY